MADKIHVEQGSAAAPGEAHPPADTPPPGPDEAGAAGQRSGRLARKPLLGERLRSAVTIVVGILALGLLGESLRGLRAKPVRETGVHVRDSGGGVPIYVTVDGDERVHWLEPGAGLHLVDARPRGASNRLYVIVPVEEGMTVCGYVDRKDLVASDVARVAAEAGAGP
jgi:hypothetical protein